MSYTRFNTLRTWSESNLSTFRSPRHIGFRKIEIQPDHERISDGPSLFHELAYCAAGPISLQIWRDHGDIESFSAEEADLIFIPADTHFGAVISATAREGVYVNALPLDHCGAGVLIVDTGSGRLVRDPDVPCETF